MSLLENVSKQLTTIIVDYVVGDNNQKKKVVPCIYNFFLNFLQTNDSYLSDPTYLLGKKISHKFFTSSSVSAKDIIHFLFRNYTATFLSSALNKVNEGDPDYEVDTGTDLTTSCINSATGCAIIFNGFLKTQEITTIMFEKNVISIKYRILSERPIQIYIKNLFNGIGLLQARQNPDFDTLSLSKKIKSIRSRSFEYGTRVFHQVFEAQVYQAIKTGLRSKNPSDETISSAIEKVFRNIEYSFNLPVLQSLQLEIVKNYSVISPSKSIAYLVAIILPSSEGSKHLDHIFFIEQYLESNKVRFMIYQSMINLATLLDELNKVDAGPMNQEELDEFLLEIENGYCKTKGLWESQVFNCFGYEITGDPQLVFDSSTNTLDGHRLLYHSYEFNPKKSLDKFVEFAKSIESLKQVLF